MALLLMVKDAYWEHREIVRATAAIGAIAFINVALLVWIARRLQELSHMRERVSRLADGLALLTDTTEAGLGTLVREVEQLGRRKTTARSASRSSVNKRVLAAARSGEALARIAETESLSESEVRLHLSLAQSAESGSRSAA
jgi:ABC-type hemin transport system ATPase subunit